LNKISWGFCYLNFKYNFEKNFDFSNFIGKFPIKFFYFIRNFPIEIRISKF
jgi:hypothetical protein